MTIATDLLPGLVIILGLFMLFITAVVIAAATEEPMRRARNWLNELRIVLSQYVRKKVGR